MSLVFELERCCKTAGQSGLLGRPGSKLLGGFGGLLGRSVPGISIAMLSIVLARHCSTPGAGPRHRSPRHYTDYPASARQSGLLNRPGSKLLGGFGRLLGRWRWQCNQCNDQPTNQLQIQRKWVRCSQCSLHCAPRSLLEPAKKPAPRPVKKPTLAGAPCVISAVTG